MKITKAQSIEWTVQIKASVPHYIICPYVTGKMPELYFNSPNKLVTRSWVMFTFLTEILITKKEGMSKITVITIL